MLRFISFFPVSLTTIHKLLVTIKSYTIKYIHCDLVFELPFLTLTPKDLLPVKSLSLVEHVSDTYPFQEETRFSSLHNLH